MMRGVKVRAGVMLYALLMMSIFTLLLQFYLNRQTSLARINKSSEAALTAYLIADRTRDKFVGDIRETEETAEVLKPSDQAGEEESDKFSPPEDKEVEEEKDLPNSGKEKETELGETAGKVEVTPKDQASPFVKEKQSASLNFKQGRADYHYEKGYLAIRVQLKEGEEFTYRFLIDSEKP